MSTQENESESERPAGLSAQALGLWTRMSNRRRAIAVGAVIAILVAVAAMSLGKSVDPYTALYTGLSPEDAGEVVSVLKERGVKYRLAAGGTAVEVPKSEVHELRISMASSGLPRGGGVGFEIFDSQSFGTTSFVEQVNYRRALQGELARSISALAAVQSARVHIAMGKRSVFREADEPPTASVALKLRPGSKLSGQQVTGIVHMVASSVDGLTNDSVVVVDDRSNVLSSGGSEEEGVGGTLQTKVESSLAERVRSMLERVVGKGHVAVVVTAEMDYSKVDQTEEMYDKDKIAVRSEVRNIEGSSAATGEVGGVAGTRGNLPGAPAAAATQAGGGRQRRVSETRNYEVPRVVRRTVGPGAKVKRLHVAVLVDHKREEVTEPAATAKEDAEAEGEDKKEDEEAAEGDETDDAAGTKLEKRPLSKEELAVVTAIAKEAAGLNEERGDSLEVRNIAFEEPALEVPDDEIVATSGFPLSKPMLYAAACGLGILLVFAALLLSRRKSTRIVRPDAISLPAPIGEVERALSSQVETKALTGAAKPPPESPNGDLYARVLTAVRSDAGHAAKVLSALLDEGNRNKA